MTYAPIACGRHDDYERARTRGDALRLHLDEGVELGLDRAAGPA